MIKEQFLDAIVKCADNNDEITITTHYKDEMYGRRTMPVVSIDEYGDEIVIHGDRNDYILLDCEHIDMAPGEENEIEFLFTVDDFITAVEIRA